MPRAIHNLAADAGLQVGEDGAHALARRIRAKAARLRTERECPTALALAVRCDPTIRRTPALDLLDQRLTETVGTPGGRLVISVPPQEGKTTLLQWSCARALITAPESRLVYVSYAALLARRSGRIVRGLIRVHGPAWGLAVAADHADASDWELDDHRGGVVSVGREGTITGRPAEGVLLDDSLKGRKEADSEVILASLHSLWESVLRPRLAPGAWVVCVQTRWSEHDLAGRFGAEGWPVLNIPALADGRAPDALARPVGTFLVSARGRTETEWRAIRADVGEREWAALYQGMPAPPEGGIFRQEWFDRDRVLNRPSDSLPPVVVVDPADNTGSGDEAGILVASTDPRQRIYLGPDLSGHMTAGRWVRVALLAVVRHHGAALAYEQSLSGLDRAVRAGWALIRKQAVVLHRLCVAHPGGSQECHNPAPDPDVVEAAAAELCHPEDPEPTWSTVRAELIELWPLVDAVLAFPPTGPNIRRILAKGTKQWRAQSVAPMFEQRRVSMVGHSSILEHQAVTWMPGQDSPDRMDAMVWAVLHLSGAAPGEIVQAKHDNLPTRSTRLRQRGGATMLPRSTR